MRPNRQLPEGLPHNARWTALESLSIDPLLTALSVLPAHVMRQTHLIPIDEMSSISPNDFKDIRGDFDNLWGSI